MATPNAVYALRLNPLTTTVAQLGAIIALLRISIDEKVYESLIAEMKGLFEKVQVNENPISES